MAPGSHHPAGEEEGARLPLQLPHHGPVFGHLVIKMFGRPPFGAQVILNGHEYVAVVARGEGIGFVKEGNCFTEIADPQRLVRVADAWSRDAAIGRLGQVCDRWIYSACLCFGLDLEEQERSGFRYGYAVYQAEYSRNLLFKSGAQMEVLFDRILDRTRSRLDIPAIRTITRPGWATPDRRCRPEPAADPGRSVRRAHHRPGPGRVHRRRARLQGPPAHRAGRLHHPAGRPRPAQAPWRAVPQQTRQNPPLPCPAKQRPRHGRRAHSPGPRYRAHPCRGPQPPHGPQAQHLDRCRP